MCLLGFTPQIQECVQCREKEELIYFSLKDNGLKCKNCGKIDTSAIEISNSTMQAIKYIIIAPAKKLYSFKLSEENQKQLSIIAKLYTNLKLEKEF